MRTWQNQSWQNQIWQNQTWQNSYLTDFLLYFWLLRTAQGHLIVCPISLPPSPPPQWAKMGFQARWLNWPQKRKDPFCWSNSSIWNFLQKCWWIQIEYIHALQKWFQTMCQCVIDKNQHTSDFDTVCGLQRPLAFIIENIMPRYQVFICWNMTLIKQVNRENFELIYSTSMSSSSSSSSLIWSSLSSSWLV